MDFARFLASYQADVGALGPSFDWAAGDTHGLLGCEPAGYSEFLSEVAKNSYFGGLLRFLLGDSKPSIRSWNSAGGWGDDWPAWNGHFVVFGYNWLGRQIGFDLRRRRGREPLVGILEPGTAQMLEVPATFSEFILVELVEFADAALAATFFETWRGAGGAAPGPAQCVGYKTPLFLGGADTVDNLELSDLSVYVSLCGQMARQMHRIRDGQPVRGVKIDRTK